MSRTFKGIHNSLRIAVQYMSDAFELVDSLDEENETIAGEIETLKKQIDALVDAIELAKETMQYVRDNKPNAEKNPEGLADKLESQREQAINSIEILKTKIHQLKEEQALVKLAEEMNSLRTLEESRLKQEEKIQSKEEQAKSILIEDHFFIFPEIERIDLALGMLSSKTESIGKRFEAAKSVAENLYNDLVTARNTYESFLISGKENNGEEIKPAEARQVFKATCASLIREALPILEKDDLSWRDFLKNLLKSFANAVIKVGSGFTIHNFFTLEQSTKEIITEAGNELQSDADLQLSV